MRKLALLVLLVAWIGCKKKDEGPPKAPAGTPTAPAPGAEAKAPEAKTDSTPKVGSKSPFAALKDLSKLGKQIGEAMGKAFGGKGSGKVVSWRALQKFLPDAVGSWKSSRPVRGSTGGFGGMKVSKVRRSYRDGERRLRLEIIDTTMSPFLRTPFEFAQAMNQDSDRGFRKGTTIGGNSAILEWRTSSKRSKTKVLVANRFLVSVRIQPATKPDEAATVAGQLDLKGLAAAK